MQSIVICLAVLSPFQETDETQSKDAAKAAAVAKQDVPTVFSGPQVGEKLPALPVRLIGSKEAIDVVKQHGENPLVIVFFHKLSRPGFQVTRAMAEFVSERRKEKLRMAVVFLTDDAPAMEKQAANIKRLLLKPDGDKAPGDTVVGFSTAGSDGPGPYGLNRNVQLTVLVTRGQKVTGNFAMGQPSWTADGPKLLKSIVKTLGGGKVPDHFNYGQRAVGDQAPATDPKLQRMVRGLMQEELADEDVAKQIAAIEKYVADRPARKPQLGTISAGLLRRNQMMARESDGKSMVNKAAMVQIETWAKLAPRRRNRNNQPQQDPKLRPLLAPLIDKSNTDEQVVAAAKEVEAYAAKNARARGQIGDICRRIIKADRLSTYGTKKCQEFMQKWAKEFKAPAAPGAKSDRPRDRAK